MRVLAPAKVNLFLRIVGRRSDGYHLLDSLMVPVSLYDEILIQTEIETGSGEKKEKYGQARILVTCDDPTLPSDETNLAYKAAALLCKEAGVHTRVSIDLRKGIPAGAGLGGGSSDAAAVLKSVNLLLSLGFSETQLCTLAVRLGADVPFFIACRPARVTGIGEIIDPVSSLPSRWLVIVVPPFSVSTPWAYRRFDDLPAFEIPPESSGNFPDQDWSPTSLVNDLERAVLPAYPLIGQIKDQLLRLGAEGALMSGSGSAVFGIFPTHTSAEQAAQILKEKGKTFIVEFLHEAPQVVHGE